MDKTSNLFQEKTFMRGRLLTWPKFLRESASIGLLLNLVKISKGLASKRGLALRDL